MSEIKGADSPNDTSQRESELQVDENSFSYLAAHPTVHGWRKKLYSLLSGESSETLWRLGSIEQYIRVLLAESKDKAAEYYFGEALSQVIQSWTPAVLESAERLNNILSLVGAFTPTVGFGKVLDYLERSERVKRSGERVSGEYELVDLYKKGLVVLAQYYPRPSFHSNDDLGFRAYTEVLERNLKDERYSGYAAVRLLQLKVFDIRSDQFASLLFSSRNAGIEVFRTLLDLADELEERESVGKKLGDILAICARADNIEKFRDLAALHDADFNPEGDYQVFFPTLTLRDGRVLEIFLDMEDVQKTALKYYVKYSSEKVRELLSEKDLNEDKVKRYVSGYLNQMIGQSDALSTLVSELGSLAAQIHTSNNNFVITVRRGDLPTEIILEVENTVQIKLIKWIHRHHPVVKTPYDFATA